MANAASLSSPNPYPRKSPCCGTALCTAYVPTANTALAVLVEQGIVREITGHPRNRVFSYTEHLRTLNEGTE